MFEDMGFRYLGPVDGHNLPLLTKILRYAKDIDEPVLLHVKTVKGKGFLPAEENPDAFSRGSSLRSTDRKAQTGGRGELFRRIWPYPDPPGGTGQAGVCRYRRHDRGNRAGEVCPSVSRPLF